MDFYILTEIQKQTDQEVQIIVCCVLVAALIGTHFYTKYKRKE